LTGSTLGAGAGAGAGILGALPFIVLGYLMLVAAYRTRYHVAHAEGQRLFFMCAAAALLIAAFAVPLSRQVELAFLSNVLEAVFGSQAGYVETLLAAALVAAILVAVLNGIDAGRRRRSKRLDEADDGTWPWVFRSLASRNGSPMQRLMIRAEQDERLIALTLSSRKVYCGIVLKLSPAFRSDDQFIEIIPMFSTARDKDTLAFGERVEYPMFHWWRATRRREQLEDLRKNLGALVKDESQRAAIHAEVSKELDALEQRIRPIEAAIPNAAGLHGQSIRDWAKVIPLKLIESASIYDEESNRIWFTSAASESPPPDSPPTAP
jgi:hypothetical protein